MLNRKIFLALLTTVCMFVISLPIISYAVAITKEKIVLTNPDEDTFKYAQRYSDNPRHQFILETKGVKFKGSDKLYTNWTGLLKDDKSGIIDCSDNMVVMAKCLSTDRVTENVDMFPYTINMKPGNNARLVCKKGEGLFVWILHPHNPDPNYVRYFADLTRLEDEDEVPLPEEVSVSEPSAVLTPGTVGMSMPTMPDISGSSHIADAGMISGGSK